MGLDEQQNFTDLQQTSPILLSVVILLSRRLFFQNPCCSASLHFSFFQSSRSFLSQQYLVTVNGYAYLGCKCFNWRIIKYSSSDTLAGYLNKDVLHTTVNYGNIHYIENSNRKWGSEIFNSWEWMKKKKTSKILWKWQSCERVEKESPSTVRGQDGHSTLDKKEKHTVIECKKRGQLKKGW